MTTINPATGIMPVNRHSMVKMLGKIPGDIAVGHSQGVTIAATCLPLIDGINGEWRGAIVRMIEDERHGFHITAEMHPLMGMQVPCPTFPVLADDHAETVLVGQEPMATHRNMTLRTFENAVEGLPKWMPIMAAASRLSDTAKLFDNLRLQVTDGQDVENWSKFSRVPGQDGDRWAIQPTDIPCDGVYDSKVCTGHHDVDEVRHTIQHMMLSVALV